MYASKLAAGRRKHTLASAEMLGKADWHRAENCRGLQTAVPGGNTPPAAARRQEAGVVASGDAPSGGAAGICFVRPLLPVLLCLLCRGQLCAAAAWPGEACRLCWGGFLRTGKTNVLSGWYRYFWCQDSGQPSSTLFSLSLWKHWIAAWAVSVSHSTCQDWDSFWENVRLNTFTGDLYQRAKWKFHKQYQFG